METFECIHLSVHEEKEAAKSGHPLMECLYRKNSWEKLFPPRECKIENGVCPYSEDGEPFTDHYGCSH